MKINLSAEDARKIANSAIGKKEVPKWVEYVYGEIEDQANLGKMVLRNPFFTCARMPSYAVKEAVWTILKLNGYKVVHKPDPDPGNPVGFGPYIEIRWGD